MQSLTPVLYILSPLFLGLIGEPFKGYEIQFSGDENFGSPPPVKVKVPGNHDTEKHEINDLEKNNADPRSIRWKALLEVRWNTGQSVNIYE